MQLNHDRRVQELLAEALDVTAAERRGLLEAAEPDSELVDEVLSLLYPGGASPRRCAFRRLSWDPTPWRWPRRCPDCRWWPCAGESSARPWGSPSAHSRSARPPSVREGSVPDDDWGAEEALRKLTQLLRETGRAEEAEVYVERWEAATGESFEG